MGGTEQGAASPHTGSGILDHGTEATCYSEQVTAIVAHWTHP